MEKELEEQSSTGATMEEHEQLPSTGATMEEHEQLPSTGATMEEHEQLPSTGANMEEHEQLPSTSGTTEVLTEKPSTNEGTRYKKTRDVVSTDGAEYEWKVSTLYFLKGLNSGRPFQLACNVEGADKFDDVVYKQETENGQEVIYYIQLKHKKDATIYKNTLTSPKNDFSIKSYFNSFLKVEANIKLEDKDTLFNVDLNQCNFVLFTNAKQSPELIKDKSVKCEEIPIGIEIGYNKEVILTLSEEGDWLSGEDLEKRKIFLSKLWIFSGQPNVNDVDEYIRLEVVKALPQRKTYLAAKEIANNIMKSIEKWWKNTSSPRTLNHRSDILDKAIEEYNLHTHSDKIVRDELELEFNDSCLTGLKVNLTKPCQLLNITNANTSNHVILCKLYQAVNSLKKSSLQIRLDYEKEDRERLLRHWRNSKIEFLILVADNTNVCTHTSEYEKELKSIVSTIEELRENDSKLIILSSENCCLVKSLEAQLETVPVSLCLNELTPSSRSNILESEILLQGKSVKKAAFFNKDSEIKGDLADFITAAEPREYGRQIENPPDNFIDRELLRTSYIKSSLFQAKTLKGKYAVSGVTENELWKLLQKNYFSDHEYRMENRNAKSKGVNHLENTNRGSSQEIGLIFEKTPFILLPSVERNGFDDLCKEHSTLHWIHKDERGFVWKAGHGSIEEVVNHIDYNTSSNYKPLELFDIEDRVVIVSGDPGIGKTSFLQKLANEWKDKNPSEWIVSIHLNEYVRQMEPNWSNFDALFSFSSNTQSFNLEKSLFNKLVNSHGNVTVLIDAFDEVAGEYRNKALSFIQYLLEETKVRKIVITTRLTAKHILENHFNTVSFGLQAFTPKDKINFLAKACPGLAKDFETVTNCLDDRFTENPLHLQMLVEVYKNRITKTEDTFSDLFTIVDMYKTFVKLKNRTFFEKTGVSIENCKELFESHCEISNKRYSAVALKVLLSDSDFQKLCEKFTIQNDYDNYMLNLQKAEYQDVNGIIHIITNNIPKFLHQAYIEYFVGTWLTEHQQGNELFFRDCFFLEEFKIVRQFFDYCVARECKLHIAVLNQNRNQVEELLESSDADKLLNKRDKAGRTPLHVAASISSNTSLNTNNDLDIVDLLLSSGADINCRDNGILNWTPLKYADSVGAHHIVNLLLGSLKLDKNAELNKPEKTIEKCNIDLLTRNGYEHIISHLIDNKSLDINGKLDDDNESTLLHKSVEYGHENLTLFLIRKNADLTSTNAKGETILHVACSAGNTIIVEHILDGLSRKKRDICDYVNKRDLFEDTAMFNAAEGGHVEILHCLHNAGGDLLIKGFNNNTLLHIACYNSDKEIVEYLLNNVSNKIYIEEYINQRNNNEANSMNIAACLGNVEIIDLLLRASGGLNNGSFRNRTALHSASIEGNRFVVEYLLYTIPSNSLERYVNQIDDDMHTAMHLAAYGGHVDIMDFLLSAGGDLITTGDSNRTPLHLASIKGHKSVVEYLLQNIPSDCLDRYVNQMGDDMNTAMHLAADGGHVEIMDFLLTAGGDLITKGYCNRTLLHLASHAGHKSVVEYLLQNIPSEYLELHVNERDNMKITAMNFAAWGGHLEIMILLLSAGGDLITKCCINNVSLLQGACHFGHMPVVEYLLSNVPSDSLSLIDYLNERDDDNDMAIHDAAIGGHVEIMDRLLRAGGDLLAKGQKNRTPLHYASIEGHIAVVEYLLQNIPSDSLEPYINQMDDENMKAKDYAIENKRYDIARLLDPCLDRSITM